MEDEVALFNKLHAPGVSGVDHRQAVSFCYGVDGGHKAHEILLNVDVFFAVGRDKDVFVRFQFKGVQYL